MSVIKALIANVESNARVINTPKKVMVCVEDLTNCYYSVDIAELINPNLVSNWEVQLLESVRGGHKIIVSATQGVKVFPLMGLKLSHGSMNDYSPIVKIVENILSGIDLGSLILADGYGQ